VVTAVALAARLGVDARAFRAWLRGLAGAGHPIVGNHQPSNRWFFSEAEADELATLYSLTGGRRARDGRASLPVLRLRGTVEQAGHLGAFGDYLSALEAAHKAAWPDRYADGSAPGLLLRRISAGSPFELELLVAVTTAGAVGLAAGRLVDVLNKVLDGRANRARTWADARKLDAETRKIDAETRRIRAEVSKLEAEAPVERPTAPEVPRELVDREEVRVVDPLGLMAEAGAVGHADIDIPDRVLGDLLAGPVVITEVAVEPFAMDARHPSSGRAERRRAQGR